MADAAARTARVQLAQHLARVLGRMRLGEARHADHPEWPAERVTTAHRAKLAYVYIRQSTAGQVRQHQESTELQYRLVERAAELGWPGERITVIDDDLGKSGTSSLERQGFQRLMAEIGLGKAGTDASRLARNNRDWHQLLELCSIFGVVLADGERLYDPRPLPRPPFVGSLRHHERGGTAPDQDAPASG